MKDIIIILDTGIDKKAFANSIIGGKNFYAENQSIFSDDNFNDDNGHGTACAYIIKNIFPRAKFYVIKVLDNRAETIFPVLEVALKYCMNLDYKLINLSLAMLQDDDNLKNLCNVIKAKGKILLASVYNGYLESYPAKYDSVIGIRGSRLKNSNKYWFNRQSAIQCIADLTPILTDRSLERYFMFGGNSKACAVIAGLILKMVNESNEEIDFNSVNNLLECNAERTLWTESDINISILPITDGNSSVVYKHSNLIRINQLLYDVTQCEKAKGLNWDDNLFKIGLIKPDSSKFLVTSIEKEFGINIPVSYINYNYLCTVKMIMKMIDGIKNEEN